MIARKICMEEPWLLTVRRFKVYALQLIDIGPAKWGVGIVSTE
jgi:hypothetical protein